MIHRRSLCRSQRTHIKSMTRCVSVLCSFEQATCINTLVGDGLLAREVVSELTFTTNYSTHGCLPISIAFNALAAFLAIVFASLSLRTTLQSHESAVSRKPVSTKA